MIFFFQVNPIGVILKIVLALPSIIIAVGGFFFSTIHETSNKTRASCGESMHFCKKNVFITFEIWIFFLQKMHGFATGSTVIIPPDAI